MHTVLSARARHMIQLGPLAEADHAKVSELVEMGFSERVARGLARRFAVEAQEAKLRAALDAAKVITPEAAGVLRQPWMGCRAGRIIAAEKDATDLWQAIVDIRRIRRAYCAAIGMQDEAPTSRGLKPNSEFPPDAEPVDPPSLAPEDERHRRAVDAWDDLSARIYAVHPLAVRYILAVVVRDEDVFGDLPLAFILREIVK